MKQGGAKEPNFVDYVRASGNLKVSIERSGVVGFEAPPSYW
jgi:hypothetical protein